MAHKTASRPARQKSSIAAGQPPVSSMPTASKSLSLGLRRFKEELPQVEATKPTTLKALYQIGNVAWPGRNPIQSTVSSASRRAA
jgi:hypothetical protein